MRRNPDPNRVKNNQKAYRERHPERIKAWQKAYRERNRERRNAQAKAWRERNVEHVEAYGKAYHNVERYRSYYKRNAERRRAEAKAWRQRNAEQVKASKAAYRERNREQIAVSEQKYKNERRKRDLTYRLIWYTSTKINKVLRANNLKKTFASFDVLPYTPQQLLIHLQEHFLPGMTPENHGYGKDKWHIDHNRPLASFHIKDFESPEALVYEAFALSNLRPMWQADNRQKSSHWKGYRWSRGHALSAS